MASSGADLPSSRPPQRKLLPRNTHACTKCQQRKVRCDGKSPCSNCSRSNVQCAYKPLDNARRRRIVTSDTTLRSRLEQAEELLRQHGLAHKIEPALSLEKSLDQVSLTSPGEEQSPSTDAGGQNTSEAREAGVYGQVYADSGGKKFTFMDGPLWDQLHRNAEAELNDNLESEFASDDDPEDESFAEGLLALESKITSVQHLFPPFEMAARLWRIFQENIAPLTMYFHGPTFWKELSETYSNPSNSSHSSDALYFSVFAFAVVSMNEISCEQQFGETKSKLEARYLHATRQALINARYLDATELKTLQAYALYITSITSRIPIRLLWVMSGTAMRMAQLLGLHKDSESMQVRPFEREYRVRLMWSIAMTDGYSGTMSGAASWAPFMLRDLRLPTNCDDGDLSPEMKELPADTARSTDMMNMLIRCQTANALLTNLNGLTPHGRVPGKFTMKSPEDWDAEIDKHEQTLEEKYLRYCDLLNPAHLECLCSSRIMLRQLRLSAAHPWSSNRPLSLEQRDRYCMICIEVLEYHSMVASDAAMDRFRWRRLNHVPFMVMIYLFTELNSRPTQPAADRAWTCLRQFYTLHPDAYITKRRPLVRSVNSLALHAWEKSGRSFDEPEFITQIKLRKMRRSTSEGISPPTDPQVPMDFEQYDQIMEMSPPEEPLFNFETDLIDWSQWEQLVRLDNLSD